MRTTVPASLALALGIALAATPVLADVTIGVTLSSTGNGAALGIPMQNSVTLWPGEIDGERLNIIVLDDGGDPSAATTNARRLVNENRADVLIGSSLTPATLAVAGVAYETKTPHFAGSPADIPGERGSWTFVLPQKVTLMAEGLFEHMKAQGVTTVGYIGFSDSWGDLWVRELKQVAEPMGIRMVAEERYARADTSVSGQALKLLAARPDAVLVGASGTGAALPQIALRQRGYGGLIYQTHGAVTKDFIRVAGDAAEGAIFASGPVMVAELQPDGAETKAPGLAYVQAYEEKYGADTRTQFGAHLFDAMEILKRAVPVALQSAEPGTEAFRTALRDAIEGIDPVPTSQGVFDYGPDDHFGLDERARVLLTVENGAFALVE